MSSTEDQLDRELVAALQHDLQGLLDSLQVSTHARAAQIELKLDADDLCTGISELGIPQAPEFPRSVDEINRLATEYVTCP